jgi:hypothetical protein
MDGKNDEKKRNGTCAAAGIDWLQPANPNRYSQSRPPAETGRCLTGSGFLFITPSELPSEVLHARVIDTDGYLYTFNTLDPTSSDPTLLINGRKWLMAMVASLTKSKNPHSTLSSAGNLYDQQTYETSAVFGPDTWLRMKTPPIILVLPAEQSGTTNGFSACPRWQSQRLVV